MANTSNIDHRHRRPRRSSDAGVTLIEIVIGAVLLGTVVIGVISATRVAINSSVTSREAAEVETALLNASDRLSRAPLKCSVGAYQPYVGAAIAVWGGQGSASADVSHFVYDSADGATGSVSWSSGPCPSGAGSSTVQRITISITGPEQGVTRSMVVFKSRIGGRNV